MALPFTAGQRLTAADLNAATQQSAWTVYTPVWTASSVNPAVGAGGSITGRYSKVGRLVTVRAGIYCGASTTFGTGFYSLSLPFTAVASGTPASQFAATGSWVLGDSGTTYFDVNAAIVQSTPGVVNGIVNSSGSFFASNNPMVWNAAAGTSFVVTITYESTS